MGKNSNSWLNKFKWNREYILQNRLNDEILERDGIKRNRGEVFIEIPQHKDYYISQYGRAISLKGEVAKLLKPNVIGEENQYHTYTLCNSSCVSTVTAQQAVAMVFCPNFWKKDRTKPRSMDRKKRFNWKRKLEVHHIDGNGFNNHYKNLVMLPRKLHVILHSIKKIVLYAEDGSKKPYKNILDLVYDTGLKLEDILQHKHRKRFKKRGKYTVYNIKGNLIGFQYYPSKES